MLILIDIGNSNIVFSTSDTKKIRKTYHVATDTTKSSDEYNILFNSIVTCEELKNVVISSVVPKMTTILKEMFEKNYGIIPLMISKGIKTGINIKSDHPKEVGSDLVCACAGAVYNNLDDCLIIDLGTANKFIYLKDKTILGVVISPGVKISMNALVTKTALLPDIDLEVPQKILGTNTITCMQSGVIYGAVFQIDGFIRKIKKEVNNQHLKVIATGGLSKLIIPLCEEKIEINENLVLEGLLEIYNKNA